jgi:formamidopyrimidine-DNA glycosylase
MPELPEVEVLARHLAPLIAQRTIEKVLVRRARVLGLTAEKELRRALMGATFTGLSRRGKYLVFTLQAPGRSEPLAVVGHLGMTGRMYLSPKKEALPKHAAVVLDLGAHHFVYEDTRYFGRFTLDASGLAKLGPEPLGAEFTVDYLALALKRSAQSIKVKLLDQTLVAGVGNIYASEALFLAKISPRTASRKLTGAQVKRLHGAVKKILAQAIRRGSTLPLDFGGEGAQSDGLFYFGGAGQESKFSPERLMVYDRAGKPCLRCGTSVKRLVQAARSTFFCPNCQRVGGKLPKFKL